MLIYFIRHGESATNALNQRTGWADVPLTEKGYAQAGQAGQYLQKIHFDKIFTSDLTRAQETARTALPGCTFETTPLLREINVGDLAYKTSNECIQLYGEEYRQITAGNNFRAYHGEDWTDLMARCDKFRQQIANETGTLAVFAHAGPLRAMLELTFGFKIAPNTLLVDNCCIALFDVKDGMWRFAGWNLGRV